MDPLMCPGPFDMIIERKTLQLFPEDERAAALALAGTTPRTARPFLQPLSRREMEAPCEALSRDPRLVRRARVGGLAERHPVTGQTVWLFQSTG